MSAMGMGEGMAVHCHIFAISESGNSYGFFGVVAFSFIIHIVICVVDFYKVVSYIVLIHSSHLAWSGLAPDSIDVRI